MNKRYSSLFAAALEKKDCPHECIALIRKAEAHAGHAQDWRLCAETWLECFKDADNAARCLLEAECRFHDNCRELAACASAWLALFNNPVAAQRCVEKITGHAKSAEDWDYCAEFLAKASCRELAGFCLVQAEKYATTKQDWQQRAAAWRDLLQDEANGKRCADAASISPDAPEPDKQQAAVAATERELIETATDLVVRERRSTNSFLARSLNISYNRAACIMEELERRGVVSPQVGSSPREILLDENLVSVHKE